MNRRNVVRLALAAALFGAAIPAASQAQVVNAQVKYWTPKAQVQVQVQSSQRFQDRFHRDMFEGRWVAQDRFDTNARGNFGGGGRAVMLPDFLNIDQSRRMISIADRRNHLLQLIAIDNGFHGRQSGATVLQGNLNGNRLVANGAGPRGQQMKQVMILQNHGNTLVVRTQVQRGNRGRIVEMEKVYQRA
jgi:hypothetical protein